MDKEQQLIELKDEYVRIQGDLEKVESTGNDTTKLQAQLVRIEEEIKALRKK
ncbi:SE1832 family protein [Abyssicoccus albus]|uniref:Uncharacterized protein n=1 Tax=Abyssicoccus albus TaxID=1817405 RepID=A0A3N5BFV7_9BACL|nr:SE1832 family protein [Abyssicoccus albus]RPF56594.1 hypothetical protein EDD62_1245 [Abyssicoccus albus]